MSESKKIFSLIPQIMKEVGAIGKSGWNEFDKYKFRSIDDVYSKLQPVLAAKGVFFKPDILESTEERFKSQKGTDQVRVKMKVKYTFYADDGSHFETQVEGEAIDRGDKATNKAFTAALKYMLIQVFCIAVEGQDDADKESPELSFTKEAPAATPKAKPKNHAPQTSKDFKIADGKFKGQLISSINPDELLVYIKQVSDALSETGRPCPKWFKEVQAYIDSTSQEVTA
jgi:hypothetical protein